MQTTEVLMPAQPGVRYSRTDMAALRLLLCRIPIEAIIRLHYDEDRLEELGLEADGTGLREYLNDILRDLSARLVDSNPHLAELLQSAVQTKVWSKKLTDLLIETAESGEVRPAPTDFCSQWLRRIVTDKLREDGILSLADLVETIQRRGYYWYLAIRGLGEKKALAISTWLQAHEGTLGSIRAALVRPVAEPGQLVMIEPFSGTLAPLERCAVSPTVDGRMGDNRAPLRPMIRARNDIEAIQSWLQKHDRNEKTYRHYRKEAERFMQWCIMIKGIALSSVYVEDCNEYIDFMAAPPANWCGPRQPRNDVKWRPFTGPLTDSSQRNAQLILGAMFEYLCRVNYLQGNPWIGTRKIVTVKPHAKMKIANRVSLPLWERLADTGGILDTLAAMDLPTLREEFKLRGYGVTQGHSAMLAFIAAIRLGTTTGLRCSEMANARIEFIEKTADQPLYELTVIGKGSKERKVYIDDPTYAALQAHWLDTYGNTRPLTGAVLSPRRTEPVNTLPVVDLTATGAARRRQGYSTRGLFDLITSWLKRIACATRFDLAEEERHRLQSLGVHSLRHSFGNHMVQQDMPLDVVRHIMGHASLNTTSIYVESEDERAREQVGLLARKRKNSES